VSYCIRRAASLQARQRYDRDFVRDIRATCEDNVGRICNPASRIKNPAYIWLRRRRVRTQIMSGRVLLVINFATDFPYPNRHVLREMYAHRFDGLALSVSKTCPSDADFQHVVQSWQPSRFIHCPCGNRELGEHSIHVHTFHSRLIDIAAAADGYEFVVFAEDDCILSPRLDAEHIRRRCQEYDALLSPIWPCYRDDPTWVWLHHESGYPEFDTVSERLDRQRLLSNWAAYSDIAAPDAPCVPMFFSFSDWLVFRVSFLQSILDDLRLFQDVWGESAIPTAILHNTSRIGRSNGIALWHSDRQQLLADLMHKLRDHDFVHPIKLLDYPREELLDAYRTM
jgi:hypothetical protein